MFGRIDWDDRALGAVFLLSSAVSLGLVTVPGTTLFSDTLVSFGPSEHLIEVSISRAVSLGALLATIATNRTDFSSLTGVEMWVAIAMVGLVIAPPLAPVIAYYLESSFIAGGFAIIIQAAGFGVVSYFG